MNNSNDPARFDGHDNPVADGTEPLDGGVLPEDFGERLEQLKELSGLSWRGFAKALGVDPKQLRIANSSRPSAWTPSSVAHEGRRALRRSNALHLPLRVPDTRRPAGHPGRGHPDDLVRGGELDNRPRRVQAHRRHGGA